MKVPNKISRFFREPPKTLFDDLEDATAEAPVSAGLLTRDSPSRAAHVFRTPRDIGTPVAAAVTLEPEGGVPAPTGEKYLIGTLHQTM